MVAAQASPAPGTRDFSFSIDRGGTFTDVYAEVPDGHGGRRAIALKLLSEDPANYPDAPREGIRRVLESVTGVKHPRDKPLDTSRIRSIRMGTTVATNALLERKGERVALLVTKGLSGLLEIGNQARPRIFDLEIATPDLLYEEVVEVDEEVIIPLGAEPSGRAGRDPVADQAHYTPEGTQVEGVTGETVCVRRPIDLAAVRAQLEEVRSRGIDSLAVVFKHSALYPEHELAVGRVAEEMGFSQVSLSSQVMQMVKMVPRGFTATADAYLTPHIDRYLETFQAGFDDGLHDVNLSFMQSDGGLAPLGAFSGHKAVLSGPAGGYVGYAVTTKWEGADVDGMQVIGFDMGGTSTDVSRYAGTYEHVFESTTAGVTIQAPQLDINTVAAGGGSRLKLNAGAFAVGPDSVGAHPGPVCYRKGGDLAVTDANLVLGRLLPDHFPAIFGPNEDEPLDADGARRAFADMADRVNAHARETGLPAKSVDEVAAGFLRVANEAMCRPIRALTQMKGYEVEKHVLACFGGAGGQHACAIARALGMRTVFVHKYSGILSAVGIGLADVVKEAQEPAATVLTESALGGLSARLEELAGRACGQLREIGFPDEKIRVEKYLNLRYDGTDVAVMVQEPENGSFLDAFEAQYRREFGFTLESRSVIVDDLRARACGQGVDLDVGADGAGGAAEAVTPAPVHSRTSAYFEETGRADVDVYVLQDMLPGHAFAGPAIVIDNTTTIVVEPRCNAVVTNDGSLRIDVLPTRSATESEKDHAAAAVGEPDPIMLAVFSHRFMGIAEQMGRTLQRTSVSVTIKERLDFSCALFGPDGALVANAPHLPVHLGAMSEAVRFQLKYYTEGPGAQPGPDGSPGGIAEGDVLVANHPQLAGGSHLPDITVITPVFEEVAPGRREIVFFVASRGHHVDVGGISPGSMPPHSTSLDQEGAAITTFKLVRGGQFQEEGIRELLTGTRCMEDNLSDLRAQVAANARGITLTQGLVREHGLGVVQAYMGHIQANAEAAVREMLREFSAEMQLPEVGSVEAEDVMDDGSVIKLRVTVDRRDGSAVLDFTGTSPEVLGNTNAPPAVTYSAVIYSMRCLVTRDIPLNQGCLAPIEIVIPEGTILSPSPGAAVVGGNVLTSQRVTDVVLKAFKACAASQGCMNNFTFGDERMGYYETIAGGAGAGPTWHGKSAVQTHMTNTRITDPEILERRYPVVLKRFEIRKGSGGRGLHRGGDGAVREVEFLRPMTASILSERRAHRPFGLLGGGPGAPGLNVLSQRGGRTCNVGGKASVQVKGGDVLTIHTPGGGGYGAGGAEGEGHFPGEQRTGYFATARKEAREEDTSRVQQMQGGSLGGRGMTERTV
ncbi:unnamed protein product [Pedinophyceae sp. YPF-701]|nr:unnamed protein product [Pedinophyceae sp. YPF-701]